MTREVLEPVSAARDQDQVVVVACKARSERGPRPDDAPV